MNRDMAKILAQVLVWAYKHHIETSFFRKYDYGDLSYPTLRFRKGDKVVEESLWRITDFSTDEAKDRCRHMWESVAHRLLVEPLVFLNEG